MSNWFDAEFGLQASTSRPEQVLRQTSTGFDRLRQTSTDARPSDTDRTAFAESIWLHFICTHHTLYTIVHWNFQFTERLAIFTFELHSVWGSRRGFTPKRFNRFTEESRWTDSHRRYLQKRLTEEHLKQRFDEEICRRTSQPKLQKRVRKFANTSSLGSDWVKSDWGPEVGGSFDGSSN